MQILSKKRQMLYKNELGGKIMVRVSLPFLKEDEGDVNCLYSALFACYFESARAFIENEKSTSSYFLDVTYETEQTAKYTKIKRVLNLRDGLNVIKTQSEYDWFENSGIRLKK